MLDLTLVLLFLKWYNPVVRHWFESSYSESSVKIVIMMVGVEYEYDIYGENFLK